VHGVEPCLGTGRVVDGALDPQNGGALANLDAHLGHVLPQPLGHLAGRHVALGVGSIVWPAKKRDCPIRSVDAQAVPALVHPRLADHPSFHHHGLVAQVGKRAGDPASLLATAHNDGLDKLGRHSHSFSQ
jgi:hypothetical protein